MAHIPAASAEGVGATPSFDSTGVGTLIVGVAYFGAQTLSDNKGNTFAPLTEWDTGGVLFRLFHCISPTVGAGHVITSSVPQARVMVIARSEVLTLEAGNTGVSSGGAAVNVINSGSITTAGPNRLLVSGGTFGNGIIGLTINGGYTAVHGYSGAPSESFGGGMAYLQQTSAGTTNPQWSWGGNANAAIGAHAEFSGAADSTPPTITSSTTFTAAENSTAVATLTANEAATWAIVGGADAARFSINASTGALAFVTAPDFEVPTDADTDNVYVVQVQATDAASNASAAQTVSVTLTNVVEGTPPGQAGAITSPTVTTASITVPFTPGSGADSHDIELSTNSGSSYAAAFNVTTNSFTVAAAVIGTTYTARITAKNASGNATAISGGTFRVDLGAATVSGGTFVAALIPFLNQ